MTLTCNGLPAQVEDLLPALVNYGHFTSLQVRDHAVQGLDLHLARLSHATRELFGSEFVEGYVATKSMELTSFFDEISPWERRVLSAQA